MDKLIFATVHIDEDTRKRQEHIERLRECLAHATHNRDQMEQHLAAANRDVEVFTAAINALADIDKQRQPH